MGLSRRTLRNIFATHDAKMEVGINRRRTSVIFVGIALLSGLLGVPGCGGDDEVDRGNGKAASVGGAGGKSGFDYQAITDKQQGELLGDDTEESSSGAEINPDPAEPPSQDCTPGTRACRCNENYTCDTGMDCFANVCGSVQRWGPWSEGAAWPESQGLVWGDPAAQGGASSIGGMWE